MSELEQYKTKLAENEVEANKFRSVFLDENGQFVLYRILDRLKFLQPCKNEEDTALNNFAKELVVTIYGDQEKNEINTSGLFRLVRTLLKLLRKNKK
jgi:hypothetical protein